MQILCWGLYAVVMLYLYFIERIALAIPAFIVVAVYLAGLFSNWGNSSPAMPLLFLSLPLIYNKWEKHYFYYASLALLMLVTAGTFNNPYHFILYLVFAVSAGVVYVVSRPDLMKIILSDKTKQRTPEPRAEKRITAVDDPFMPLKNYIERMTLWEKTITIQIRVIEIHEENGRLIGAETSFPLAGIIRLAVKNRREIACTTILEEKDSLPMMPGFNKRVYFPVSLFSGAVKDLDPDYVIAIDAHFDGDRQLLVEKFAAIRDDVTELLRMGVTFEQIFLERRRKEHLYNGARRILDSFKRENLFQTAAWAIFQIVPETATVLITEKRRETHLASIYNRVNLEGEPLSADTVSAAPQIELSDTTSIQSMLIEGKIGRMSEVRDIKKRKENNKLFTESELISLNTHNQMYSYLLHYDQAAKGTVSVFIDGEEDLPGYVKTDLMLIAQIISSALNNIEMYETVEELSNVDALTGLYNRRYLQENIEKMVLQASRSGIPVSTIMLDIDHFKKVNDRYGHKAGDDVIKFMGRTLRSSIRKVDIAARYGGEEFVLLLHNTTPEGAAALAEKIRETIKNSVVSADGNQLNITSSFGVSSFPGLAPSHELLIKTADEALYQSKQGGRNRVTVYKPAEE